jgi:tellurium resistance protein TerD
MTSLTKGGNVSLGPAGAGGLSGLVLGLTWDSGALECDMCALVCGADRKVLDDEHFLFWDNQSTPDRSVMLRQASDGLQGPGRAQVVLGLDSLPEAAQRVVISLSTISEGGTLAHLQSLQLEVLDGSDGRELTSYEMGKELTIETCLLVGEVYLHNGVWKVRAIGAGYDSGLHGLSRDYGVNVV